jgi:hypothetical protein
MAYPILNDDVEALVGMLQQILKDAERWQYVRNNLCQIHSLQMNGEHSWRIRAIYSTGPTIDEAIDKEMNK